MRIYLSGSARTMGDDLPYLRRIVKVINDNKATITRNWIESAHQRGKQGVQDKDADWGSIYHENIEAINRSDVAIIEASQNRFSQGFWVYATTRLKLPTLIVTRHQNHTELYKFSSKFTTIKVYDNENELAEIASEFIKANTIAEKDLRFNFFIDRQIYKYLRDTSYRTGKNKSEVIRQLLQREIKRRES